MKDEGMLVVADEHAPAISNQNFPSNVDEYATPPHLETVEPRLRPTISSYSASSECLANVAEDVVTDNTIPVSEDRALSSEAALLDLEELEELHSEAERMKAIGNKHMASQEYLKAYQAYSTALQLSPVGPSSHVFLSNRAAALLSLKRYPAAATDAKRAVALAPTFGKAHARLGQALYFLKDYNAAVQAYEDAIRFEPSNEITQTYLEKAKSKLHKQQLKKNRHTKEQTGNQQDESSSMAESTLFTVQNSIATDPQEMFSVVQKEQFRGMEHSNNVMKAAVTGTKNTIAKLQDQVQQRDAHTVIGLPSSSQSLAASAITVDSDDRKLPQTLPTNISQVDTSLAAEDDPEFEEALRIQQRANKYLVQKHYRAAIEEYTAALFLVPDDPVLSPDLHLGRAHALNGSRRHESARNDALLAVKLNPSPAAYSTLAKSLFYMKHYAPSIDAFEKCISLLPPGESLGSFDRAYLEKAEKALAEQESHSQEYDANTPKTRQQQPMPKLPPPRFVPREEALLSQAPALRPMPKEWPQQPAMKSPPLKCGKEREVIFMSEALGVKLNRGCDGIVRVLSVTPMTAGSVILRQGEIDVGDIVREAAGVDIRRPITNIMWGDTVALIKMSPRPISFLVAKELSPVPIAVREEQKKREQEIQLKSQPIYHPSNAIGDESVFDVISTVQSTIVTPNEIPETETMNVALSTVEECENDFDIVEVKDVITHDIVEVETDCILPVNGENISGFEATLQLDDDSTSVQKFLMNSPKSTTTDQCNEPCFENTNLVKSKFDSTSHLGMELPPSHFSILSPSLNDDSEDIVEIDGSKGGTSHVLSLSTELRLSNLGVIDKCVCKNDDEIKIIGGEILFMRDKKFTPYYNDWDTLRWMAYSGSRKASFCQIVYRQFEGEKSRSLIPSFWKTGGKRYERRALAVYEEPNVIMVLRRPSNISEVNDLLGLPDIAYTNQKDESTENYWVLETAIDPSTAKLRLSSLTTLTAVAETDSNDRDRSCFQILTPIGSLILSAVQTRTEFNEKQANLYKDSAAYLETLVLETSLAKTLCAAHLRSHNSLFCQFDMAWKHQIVVGSLHSIVISGNHHALDQALDQLRKSLHGTIDVSQKGILIPSSIINATDDEGCTALYYACKFKMHAAVKKLLNVGADCSIRFTSNNSTLYHIVAQNLDHLSLSILLASPNTAATELNLLDRAYRTPMYIASTVGSIQSVGTRSEDLDVFIHLLVERGGLMFTNEYPKLLQHPVSILASNWLPDHVAVVLKHLPFYCASTTRDSSGSPYGVSISAFYGYPVHTAIHAMRKNLNKFLILKRGLFQTLLVLFKNGFEPNERIDFSGNQKDGSKEIYGFFGFAPIQVLAFVAFELKNSNEKYGPKDFSNILSGIADTAEFLIRNGARISLSPPPTQRQRTHTILEASEESQIRYTLANGFVFDIHMMTLLGNTRALTLARTEWQSMKKIDSSTYVNLHDVTADEPKAPGGNDRLSCFICWVNFGSILNRKHRCRSTGFFVCDECSTKRVERNGIEYRVSDGQFIRIKAKEMIQNKMITASKTNVVRSTSDSLSLHLDPRKKQDNLNRESLFGGFIGKATNFLKCDEFETPPNTLGELSSSLENTHEILNQRAEKLTKLSDKSAQLVDASSDFAKMAKELNRQAESGFFW